jgi:hypothetical protein
LVKVALKVTGRKVEVGGGRGMGAARNFSLCVWVHF